MRSRRVQWEEFTNLVLSLVQKRSSMKLERMVVAKELVRFLESRTSIIVEEVGPTSFPMIPTTSQMLRGRNLPYKAQPPFLPQAPAIPPQITGGPFIISVDQPDFVTPRSRSNARTYAGTAYAMPHVSAQGPRAVP